MIESNISMNTNQNGFGVIGIVIIVTFIGLLGGGLWYAWQFQASSNESKDSESISEATKEKSYSRYGISFQYPADWRLVADDNVQSQATTLFSPDFTPMEGYSDQVETTGQRISITESPTRNGVTADTFKSNFLDSNDNPNPYSGYKELMIDGKKAVQLTWGDSASPTTYFFLEGGTDVAFVLDTFTDKDTAVYDAIIGSVKYK